VQDTNWNCDLALSDRPAHALSPDSWTYIRYYTIELGVVWVSVSSARIFHILCARTRSAQVGIGVKTEERESREAETGLGHWAFLGDHGDNSSGRG